MEILNQGQVTWLLSFFVFRFLLLFVLLIFWLFVLKLHLLGDAVVVPNHRNNSVLTIVDAFLMLLGMTGYSCFLHSIKIAEQMLVEILGCR